VGAQATGPEEAPALGLETARLVLNGPRDAIRRLRATLCTVRRAIERRTGTAPDGLRFELGLRPGRTPLVVYGA